jgi:hypothetical protein
MPGEECELTTGLRRNAPHRERRLAAENGRPADLDGIVPNMQSCCVSFRHCGAEYSNTTMGLSLLDAATKALEFFYGPNWKGPRPRRNTVLAVTLIGE